MSILFSKNMKKCLHLFSYTIKGCICSLSKAYSIDFIIYLGEKDNAVGFVIGLCCENGMKYIFLLLSNFPIFSAFVLSPSFATIP